MKNIFILGIALLLSNPLFSQNFFITDTDSLQKKVPVIVKDEYRNLFHIPEDGKLIFNSEDSFHHHLDSISELSKYPEVDFIQYVVVLEFQCKQCNQFCNHPFMDQCHRNACMYEPFYFLIPRKK